MNEKYKKLGKNTGWMIIGNFASKLLSFFLVPLYTYCLSTSDYGIADLMTTTVSLLSPVLTIAASEGILRFTLDEKTKKEKIFTLSMIIFCIGFAILVVASPIIQRFASFKDYHGLFILYYFTNVLTLLLQQFVKGLNRIKEYAVSGFVHTLVGATLNIFFLAVFHKGVIGYLYAMIFGSAAPSVYLIIKVKLWKYLCNPIEIKRNDAKQYLIYCLPLVANQLSWWINNSSDKYVLTYYWGTSINGIYSVAYKIPSLIATISTIFYSAWQISAVEEFGSQASIKFYSDVYRKYVSVLAISSSGIVLFIKIMAKLLFANDFFQAWPYAVILVLAAIFQSLNSFIGTIYTSAYKPKAILYTTLLGAAINTCLNFVLIPKIGAYGAAVATLLSYIVILIIRVADSRKYLRIDISYRKDVSSYFILFFQSFYMCGQFPGWKIVNLSCLIALFVINKEISVDLFRLVQNGFRRKIT